MTELTIISKTTSTSSFQYAGPEWKDNYSFVGEGGINFWVLDKAHLTMPPFTFHTFTINQSTTPSFIKFIKELPIGIEVAMMIIGKLPYFTTELANAISKLGSTKIFSYGTTTQNFCLIGRKGTPIGGAVESMGDGSQVEIKATYKYNSHIQKLRHLKLNYTSQEVTVLINYNEILSSTQSRNSIKNGINVYTLDDHFHVLSNSSFDTTSSDGESKKLLKYIDSLDQQTLVLFIAKGSAQSKLSADAVSKIKEYGSNIIDQYAITNKTTLDKWFMLSKKKRINPFCEYTGAIGKDLSCYYFHTVNLDQPFSQDDDSFGGNQDDSEDLRISTGSSNSLNQLPTTVPPYYAIVNSNIIPKMTTNGFVMTVLNEVAGNIYSNTAYNIDKNNPSLATTMAMDILDIPIGSIVIISSNITNTNFQMTDQLSFAFQTLGSELSYDIVNTSSYSIIGRKGSAPGSVPELLSNSGPVALYTNVKTKKLLSKPFIDIKAISLAVDQNNQDGYSKFLINQVEVPVYTDYGFNILTINPTTGGIIGFEIVDWYQANTLESVLSAIPDGTIVALSVLGFSNIIYPNLTDPIIKYLGGTEKDINNKTSYCIIATKLSNSNPSQRLKSECIANPTIPTSCLLRLPVQSLYSNVSGFSFCITSKGMGNSLGEIMVNNSLRSDNRNGLNVVAVNPYTEVIDSSRSFDTQANPSNWSSFYDYIQGKENGTIIAIAVKYDIGIPTDPYYQNLKKLAFSKIGAHQFISVPSGGSYAVLGIVGSTPGEALESVSSSSSQVCVGAWFPNKITTTIVNKQLSAGPYNNSYLFNSKLPNIFNVPSFVQYYQLNNPNPVLPKKKAIGFIPKTEPAYNWTGTTPSPFKTIETRNEATISTPGTYNQVKALLIGVSYKTSPGATIDNIEKTIEDHAQALINSKYIQPVNIKVLTETLTELSISNGNTIVCGPSAKCITNEVQNWLTKGIKSGDTIYVAFFGRGYSQMLDYVNQPEREYDYGICPLNDALTATDYSLNVNRFQNLFANVPAGVNVTMLLDCAYAGKLLQAFPNTPISITNQTIGLLATEQSKLPPFNQTSVGLLPTVTNILNRQYKSNPSVKLSYSQIFSSVTSNPNYRSQPVLYNFAASSNIPFLSSIV
eukprot:gene6699-8286_t